MEKYVAIRHIADDSGLACKLCRKTLGGCLFSPGMKVDHVTSDVNEFNAWELASIDRDDVTYCTPQGVPDNA